MPLPLAESQRLPPSFLCQDQRCQVPTRRHTFEIPALPTTTRSLNLGASSSCILPPNSYAGLPTPSTPSPSGFNPSQQSSTALPTPVACPTLPDMATHMDNQYRTDWENFVTVKALHPKICVCQRHPMDRTHPTNYKPSAMEELLQHQGENPNLFIQLLLRPLGLNFISIFEITSSMSMLSLAVADR